MVFFLWRLASIHRIEALAVLFSLALCGMCGAEPIRIQRIPAASPVGSSAAVRVANAELVHTTQLLPPDTSSDAPAQITGVLSQLDRVLQEFQSKRSDVVKLHLYVRDAATREAFLTQLADWSAGHAPAVASVATPLPDPNALVGLDAVFASRRSDTASTPERMFVAGLKSDNRRSHASVLPKGDAVYISGQAEPGDFAQATRATLDGLERTLQLMQLGKQHIVQIKCYMRPMSDAAVVNEQLAAFFGNDAVPPVSLVEWVSAPWPIEIDLVAWAPVEESSETVSFSTPPWMPTSPVYSKVARVHGNDRIYVAGLTSPESGTGEQQVRGVFHLLENVAKDAGSDMRHLVKATYYVANDEVSKALNSLRPEFYDPERPPAASKALVVDIATPERSLALDMIAVPTPTKAGGE